MTREGKVQLHKAKRNTNMTFSIGKTWALQDMRVVEVQGVSIVSGRLAALHTHASKGTAATLRVDHDQSDLRLADGASE